MTEASGAALSGMRVLVLADFDSFMRAAAKCAFHLEGLGARTDFVIVQARRNQISTAQLRSMGIGTDPPTRTLAAMASVEALSDYDVVFVGLNGLRTRRFLARVLRAFPPGGARRPVLISLYPGLLFRFHLEGMMSRMNCDLFALNSPSDKQLYLRLCAGVGVSGDNALCLGLTTVPGRAQAAKHDVPSDGTITFVGQPTVPAGRHERLFVLARLCELARREPNRRIVVKPRHRPGETTLHRVRHHYERLLPQVPGGAPPNLAIRYDPIDQVLANTRVCVTFSSTAALEAVALGIPTRIVTDLGINENLGNHFFLGSGMLADLDSIHGGLASQVDPDWRAEHLVSADDNMPALVARIQALVEQPRDQGLPAQDRVFARSQAFTRTFQRAAGQGPALDVFGDTPTVAWRATLLRWLGRA